jgi:hypothetical protein
MSSGQTQGITWNFNAPAAGTYSVYAGAWNSSWSNYAFIWLGNFTTAAGIPTAATPTFSLAAGTYTSAQSVKIADTTSGATIYYTTDGTTPTTSSTKYTAAIAVSATETIEAIAVASGYNNSAVASATYTISSGVSNPTFTSDSSGIPSSSVAVGSAMNLQAYIHCTGGTLTNGILGMRIFNTATNQEQTQLNEPTNYGINMTSGQTQGVGWNFNAPAAGTYSVYAGAWNSSWSNYAFILLGNFTTH